MADGRFLRGCCLYKSSFELEWTVGSVLALRLFLNFLFNVVRLRIGDSLMMCIGWMEDLFIGFLWSLAFEMVLNIFLLIYYVDRLASGLSFLILDIRLTDLSAYAYNIIFFELLNLSLFLVHVFQDLYFFYFLFAIALLLFILILFVLLFVFLVEFFALWLNNYNCSFALLFCQHWRLITLNLLLYLLDRGGF